MATIQEAKRRLTIEATTRGVDEAKQKLDALAASERGVAAANDQISATETRKERSTVSAERALNRIQRQYDATWRSMQTYERAERDLTRAQSQGLITEQRKGELLTMVAARHNQAASAARGHAAALNTLRAANQNIAGGSSFHTTNLLFQAQDIAMMTAAGQAPHILAMQQGTQVAGIFHQIGNGRQIIQALGGALVGLLNPISLVTIGLIGAGAAAVQYFSGTEDDSKKAEEALERQAALLDRLAERYSKLADAAERTFNVSSVGDRFGAASSVRELEFLLREQGGNYRTPSAIGSAIDQWWNGGAGQFDVRFALGAGGQVNPFEVAEGQFKPFEAAILNLFKTAKDGLPDFIEFRRQVLERWSLEPNNEALTKTVRIMMDATEEGTNLAEALKRVREAQRELNANVAEGFLKPSGSWAQDDMSSLDAFLRREAIASQRRRQSFDAEIMGLNARSPGERAAAAEARAAAQYNDQETAQARRERIELAGKRALIEAEHRLTEAQRERARSYDQAVAGQDLELSLIGKTAAEAAQLRFEYQQTAQLREQAARSGVAADEAEIALIREKAAAMGRYTELIARARLGEDLAFERSQLGRTSADQQIAMRLRGAGLPVDLMSPEAQQMRQNMRYQQSHEAITGFFSSFRAELLSNGGDFGDAFAKAFFNSFSKVADQMTEAAFRNLATAILGTPGGGSGILGDWLGGALGVGGSTGNTTPQVGNLARMFAPANDNLLAGAGAALTDKGGVAGQVWNFFAAKGLKPHQIAGIMGNVKAESAFNPLAVGDGGNAFGLFQHNDRRHNLFSAIGGRGNLGDVSGQLDFAWQELQTTERRAMDALLKSRNVREATAAFGGFERPSGFSWENPEGMHNWAGRLSGAESALSRFGSTATQATQNLGQFGGGLGQLAQSLMGIGGGFGEGGWFSGLMSMFGGMGGATSHMMGISPLVTRFIAGGGIGLFAKGGISDRPAIFGEGPLPEAAVPLPDGRRIPVDLRLPGWSAPQTQRIVVESHVVTRFNADGGFEGATERVVQRTAPGISRGEAAGIVGQYDDQQKRGGARANDQFYNRLKRPA